MTAAVDFQFLIGESDQRSPSERIERLRRGLPYSAVERLREELELSLDELAKAVGISTRTLSRRRKEKHLNLEESDRLFRIARIYGHALEVFGDSEKAARWFKRSHPVLDGMTPLEVFDTDLGAQLVDDLLTRVEYGVYS